MKISTQIFYNKLMQFIKKHPLVTFFIISFVFTWMVLIPIPLGFYSDSWHFLGALGPTLAALLVIFYTEGKTGINNLINKIKTPQDKSWLWFAFTPVGLLLIAIVIFYLMDKDVWTFQVANLEFLLLLSYLCYGIFEEVGWRGYALPKLQQRHSAFMSTVILTILWGLWHLPMFYYRFSFSPFMVSGFFISLFFGAIIFTFFTNHFRGNILVGIIWHILWNFVSTINEIYLTPIMSAFIVISAIIVLFRFGSKNMANKPKYTL